MTNPDGNTGETPPSESSAPASEPSSSGYEVPPIEQPQDQSQHAQQPSQPSEQPQPPQSFETPGYAPPPAYPPPGYQPTSGYPPPSFPPPEYTPPPSYPPSGSPQTGYPPPQFGTPPPSYGVPPSGYPAPNYAGGYGAPTQATNNMAIASLVASIIGVLCGIGSIVGIALGIVALNQIKQTREGGHGLAIAGIGVGAATLLINLIWTFAVLSS